MKATLLNSTILPKPFLAPSRLLRNSAEWGMAITGMRSISISALFLLLCITAKADLSKDAEPNSISTCQPNASTGFTTSFMVGRGAGCNNLSSVGNVTFIWEYFNGSAWVAVANNTPVGFTYSTASVRTGAGSGAQITNTLTLTLSSSAAIGVFSFRCRANQPTGCTNFVTSNTITVTVNAKPVPTFTAEPGAGTCINSNVTYTTQAGQSGYTWSIPGSAGTDYTITAGSTSTHTVTLQWLTTGAKTVTVNYTNANGCTAASPVASIATAVNAAPVPTFTAQPSGIICSSTNVTYTTQAGQSNYIWTLPGILNTDYTITAGSTGTASNTVTLQWLTAGSKVVTINYNNAAGCAAATSVPSNTITVSARPVPSFTALPNANICLNTDVTYTTQPGQSNYTWTLPGVLNTDYTITSGGIGTGNNTVTLKWITGGSKNVTVNYNSSDGCTGSAAASSGTTVNIPVTPTITPSGSTTFCEGGSVVLNSSSGSTYQWSSDGNIIPGETAISYTASSDALYAVKVTDAFGCEATSANTAVIVNTLPSIDAAAQAVSACFSASAQSTTLDYDNETNSPVMYSISWDAAATTAGFAAVTNAALPVSPIIVSLPAGAAANIYTGTVTVTNANTCTSTGETFTVTILAPPDVSNFNISAAEGCEGAGSAVTITSSTLVNGTYTVSYDLSGANTATGNTASMIFNAGTGTFVTALLSQGATNITVTQLTAVVCGTSVASGNTAAFVVNPLPLVSPITGASGVCIGNSITLFNATAGGSWSSTNTLIAAVNSSGGVTGEADGTVDIVYTTAPVNGCTNAAIRNITVHTLPPATPITGITALCVNTTAALSNINTGGTWSSSNTAIATINSAGVVSAISPGTTSIRYVFPANANGCTDSVIALVTVDPAATANAGSTLTVCQSASPAAITLSSSSVGGGASTGAWSIAAGGGTLSSIVQTTNPSTVTYTPAANFSGTVTLLLTTNEPGTCPAVTAAKTINVTALAVAVAGGPDTVCQSASPSAITLSGASVSGGATTGAWSVISGGGTLSSTAQTASPSTISYTPAVSFTGTVTLRLTTDIPAGCTAVTADRTINVTAAPIANAGTGVQTCADVTQTASGAAAVNITAGSSASNHTSVLWSSSGTGTFTNPASLTTATYTPSTADRIAGSVTLTLTAFGNAPCGSSTSTKIFTITPAININDANSWGQVPNCNGLGVQFTLPAAPGGGNGTFNYQWMQKNNCGTAGVSSPVPGATGMSFIPPADFCYWLQISSGGCTVPQNLVSTTTRQRPSPDTGALANISFGVSGTNPQICIGSNTVLTAQSSVAYTYTWSPSTGLSATTGATVTANPATTTTYTITAVATDGTGCTRTANNTVTVSPLTVAGTLPGSVTACNSGSSALTLTGNTGAVTQWESSTDGGTTWTAIANTGTTLNYTLAATTTQYRALVQSGACSSIYTNAAQTGLHNVWQGKTSTDWHTATNWSDHALPSLACPTVTIPAATAFSPVLNAGIATINSLVVDAAASLVITNNAKMQLAGSITNNGMLDVTDGSLEFNGAAPQNISGNAFVQNTLRNLILSNSSGLSVDNTAGNLLHVKESFAFGNVNNATLTTNDNLVLLSSADGTAAVADITNNNTNTGNTVAGKVTIQRYIPGRRAWRLLTAPVSSSSLVKISDSWQEGATRVTNPADINSANNPNPGYGTHVTFGNPATNGYDQGVNGNASVFYLTSAGWNGVPTATNNGATLNSGYITDQPGYMLFVRGDRGTQLWQATYAATTPTVLRMKGNINTGQLNLSLSPGMVWGGAHFRVVGNPYPSAVNFHKILGNASNNAAGFADAFYLWDPSVTGSNGVGGWVAMSYNSISGMYDRTVLTGGSSSINNSGDIQSGSAFIIDYAGAASSIRVEEPNKTNGSNNSQFRPLYHPNQVRINLLAKNTDSTISVNDAALVSYHNEYNSAVDRADMRKLLNFAENISIIKDSASLILERRKTFAQTDTISLQLLKMRQKNYQLQVELGEMDTPPGFIAVLEDKVLATETIFDLKTTNEYEFAVNASNIAVADRFRLLFRPVAVFMNITADQQNSDVVIKWSLSQAFNLSHFEIERSDDGISFVKIGLAENKSNSDALTNYTSLDIKPGTGNYIYRIKAVSKNGVIVYSNKATAKVISSKQGLYVFPNPVTDGSIGLQMSGIEKGMYNLKLINTEGKQIAATAVNYTGGMFTNNIILPKGTPAGNYWLIVSRNDGSSHSLQVFVREK